MTIGDRIRDFGLKKYYSIKKFAEALEVKPPNLQKYLNNKMFPGTPLLLKLESMGCDLNWLLTGKENLWGKIDSGITFRIGNTLKQLRKKYSITDEDLKLKSFQSLGDEYRLTTEREKFDSCFIINEWEEHHSLRPFHIMNIAKYAEVSLSWLLTGTESEFEKYLKGLFLSYPEIELLVKLKNNPQLFEKVSAYIDAKLLEDQIESIKKPD